MKGSLTEVELCSAVDALTPDRLLQYRRLRILTPTQTEDGPRYREIDIRRLTLLCELSDDMELNEDALVIVMSLLDQLHGTRARLDRVMRALAEEGGDVKERVVGRLAR